MESVDVCKMGVCVGVHVCVPMCVCVCGGDVHSSQNKLFSKVVLGYYKM